MAYTELTNMNASVLKGRWLLLCLFFSLGISAQTPSLNIKPKPVKPGLQLKPKTKAQGAKESSVLPTKGKQGFTTYFVRLSNCTPRLPEPEQQVFFNKTWVSEGLPNQTQAGLDYEQPYLMRIEGVLELPEAQPWAALGFNCIGAGRFRIYAPESPGEWVFELGSAERHQFEKAQKELTLAPGLYAFSLEYMRMRGKPSFFLEYNQHPGEGFAPLPPTRVFQAAEPINLEPKAALPVEPIVENGPQEAFVDGLHPNLYYGQDQQNQSLLKAPANPNPIAEQAEQSWPADDLSLALPAIQLISYYQDGHYWADRLVEKGLRIPYAKHPNRNPLRVVEGRLEVQTGTGWQTAIAQPESNKTYFDIESAKLYKNGLLLTFTEALMAGEGESVEDLVLETPMGQIVQATTVHKSNDQRQVFVELQALAKAQFRFRYKRAPISENRKQLWANEVKVDLKDWPKEKFKTRGFVQCTGLHNTLSEFQEEAHYERLFDGKDIAKFWKNYGSETLSEGWANEQGTIAFQKGVKSGDIITRQAFGSFVLELEWKISQAGNSGIFIWAQDNKKKYKAPYMTAMEMQVLHNGCHGDGAIPSHTAGANYDLYVPKYDPTLPAGEWNQVKIIAEGEHLEFWLNGVQTMACDLDSKDFNNRLELSKFSKAGWDDFAKFRQGHIGLQDHSDRVWFRNLYIKELE